MHANCIWLVSASQLRKCQTSFFAASLLFFVERSSAANWDLVDFFYYPIVFPLHPPGVQTVRDAVVGQHARTLARCTLLFTVGLESTRTTRGQSRIHVGSGCKEVQRQSAYTSQNKPCLSFSNIIPQKTDLENTTQWKCNLLWGATDTQLNHLTKSCVWVFFVFKCLHMQGGGEIPILLTTAA